MSYLIYLLILFICLDPNLQSISNEVVFSLPPPSFMKARTTEADASLDLLKNSENSGSGDKGSKKGSNEVDPVTGDLGILNPEFI